MSDRVSSELYLHSEHLRLDSSSGRVIGMDSLNRWLTSIEHKVSPILPTATDNKNTAAGEVTSPFDHALKVDVVCGSESDYRALKGAWYESTDDDTSMSSFLDRWAAAIERHADLVTLVICSFMGTCFREVRSTEIERAVAQLRYNATRCPLKQSIRKAQISKSKDFYDATHLRLGDCIDLSRLCYLLGLVFTQSRLQSRRLIISASPESSAAPLVHLLVQLAHLESPGASHVASVPMIKSQQSWAVNVVAFNAPAGLHDSSMSLWSLPHGPERSCTLIMESADLFSAVEESIAGARLWCWGKGVEAAHLVMVQESVLETVNTLLKERLSRCQLANSPDHSGADVAPPHSSEASKKLAEALSEARNDGVTIEEINGVKLLLGEQPSGPVASRHSTTGLDGAYMYLIPFRTAAEAVRLANHAPQRNKVSLWTEIPGQANEMTNRLKFRQVAVNCTAPFDVRVTDKTETGSWKWLSYDSMDTGHENGAAAQPVTNGDVLKKAEASTTGSSAAGWATSEPGERRRKLMIVAERMMDRISEKMASAVGKNELVKMKDETERRLFLETVENIFMSAEDMVAAREWSVNGKHFKGRVTVHEEAKGHVTILAENSFIYTLATLICRVLLLGNTVSVVTNPALIAMLREYNFDKLGVVKIIENKPGVMIREAMTANTVLYDLSDSSLHQLINSCDFNESSRRLFSLSGWNPYGHQLEDEILRHFCTFPKVVWTPAFDTFAN